MQVRTSRNRRHALRLALTSTIGWSLAGAARAARGDGSSREYAKPVGAVWPIVLDVVDQSGLTLLSKSRSDGLIVAQRSVSAFSWGETVSIHVNAVGKGRTRVEVVSKKAMSTNFLATNWEKRILSELDARIR